MISLKKEKYCGAGEHYVPVLFKAKTRDTPSYCKTCWGIKQRLEGKWKINKITDTERKRQAKYEKSKREYFADPKNLVCHFPGCTRRDVTLHHGAGREGSLLWNKQYFKSLCWDPHHLWVESHPDEAKAMGLSFTRLDK